MTCPHCGSETNDSFNYCSSCTRMTSEFVLCEKCREPFSQDAAICPHCASRVTTENEKLAEALELEVTATRLGAIFTGGNITGLFFPPKIKIQSGRILVTKWSLLGLRRHQQEIQVTKVASVRYTKGVFWGGILVETFGGASDDLSEKGLMQHDARTMADQLKSCLAN